ncbi:MAG: ECF transporter S component [Defluviitaleaceae bacterium]|nr:ECF transporter S component [Defluviitaleaceae bacterium]
MTIFGKQNEPMTSVHLRRMVISAMFLSLALVIRTLFRMYVPIFGESGIRISVHGIFSAMPAILFGPIYGAIVSGLTDFIGFQISPSGTFLPQLTLSAALGGFVRGGIWMIIRGKSTFLMRNLVLVISVLLLTIGTYNIFTLNSDGVGRTFYEPFTLELSENAQGQTVRTIDYDSIDTANMSAISRMAITRSINTRDPAEGLGEFIMFVTTAMVGSGIFGLLLIGVDWVVNKFLLKGKTEVKTMSLLLSMMTAAVLVSTINTIVFRYTIFTSWQLLPFSVVWLPRAMQTIATTTVMTYFVAMLLGVLERQPYLKGIVK